MEKTEKNLVRRCAGLATAGALIVGLTACGGAAGSDSASGDQELAEASFQLGWLPTAESMAMIVADEKGYYEEEGIDLTLEPGGPQVTVDAQIVSGNVMMGAISSEPMANAVAAGAPLVAVGALYQTSSSAIVTLADSGITEPSDLEGKRFGIYETDERTYGPFFDLTDVDMESIDLIAGATDPAALVSGEVDAISGVLPNQPVAIRAQGIEVASIKLADYGYNRWSGLLAVHKDSLADESKRETVAGMLRATQRGLEEAVADPEAAAQIVFDRYGEEHGLELETQIESAKIWAELASESTAEAGLLTVTDEGVASQQDFFDIIGMETDAKSLFDTAFSTEVLGASGK